MQLLLIFFYVVLEYCSNEAIEDWSLCPECFLV